MDAAPVGPAAPGSAQVLMRSSVTRCEGVHQRVNGGVAARRSAAVTGETPSGPPVCQEEATCSAAHPPGVLRSVTAERTNTAVLL